MKDDIVQEMRLHWGAQNLTRWSEEAVRDLRVPTASREFLTEIGLPSLERDVAGWYLEWDLNLSPFDKAGELRLLGRNCGLSPFLIDQSRDGCIIWRADDEGYERYINRSVEQFAVSLVEMDKFCRETWRTIDEPLDREVFALRITALEQHLAAVDPTAFAAERNMWRSEIFGMRLELK